MPGTRKKPNTPTARSSAKAAPRRPMSRLEALALWSDYRAQQKRQAQKPIKHDTEHSPGRQTSGQPGFWGDTKPQPASKRQFAGRPTRSAQTLQRRIKPGAGSGPGAGQASRHTPKDAAKDAPKNGPKNALGQAGAHTSIFSTNRNRDRRDGRNPATTSPHKAGHTRKARARRRSMALVGALALLALIGTRGQDIAHWVHDRTANTVHAHAAANGYVMAFADVRGANMVDVDWVVEALGHPPDAPLTRLDLKAAKARIEASPFVRHAAVMRLYPNRVVVMLDEREPLAVWLPEDGATPQLVDAQGQVIDGVDASQFAALPVVSGPGAPLATPDLVASLAQSPDVGVRVKHAVRVGERRWDVTLASGAVVSLPEGPPAPSIALLNQLNSRNGLLDWALARIDLRNGLVLAGDILPTM